MHLIILKSDLNTEIKINYLNYLFKNNHNIFSWSINNEDIDNVLRIEAHNNITENKVIKLLKQIGVHCEPLPE